MHFSYTHRRSMLVAIAGLAVIGASVACAPEEDDPEASAETAGATSSAEDPSEGSSGAFPIEERDFTDEEIESILTWLAPLPEAPPADPSNAWADDPAAAQLGQKLFFDPRYSGNGEVSCATCHEPTAGFGDSRANTSEGIGMTGRASIGLLNGAYGAAAESATNWQQWDGRADSQWSQALGPPESPVVMGSTRTMVALLLHDEYRSEYEAVFGAMPALRDADGNPVADPTYKPGLPEWDALPEQVRADISEVYVNFGKAVAAYERLLESRNSRFDQYWRDLADGRLQSDALDDLEKEGLRVFIGPGRCLGCHSGPNFTDNQFHNVAVPQTGDNVPEMDDGRAGGVPKLIASEFNCAGPWSDHPDKAQCAVEGLQVDGAEIGAFRTPSLRSISQTPPYMHTGNFATLEDVVRHYDLGGAPTGSFLGVRDELLRPLALDPRQRAALVAFLRALDGEPLPTALMGPL